MVEFVAPRRIFERDEYDIIERMLRAVYAIRTATGEEDELLADFIEALSEGARIEMVEDDD